MQPATSELLEGEPCPCSLHSFVETEPYQVSNSLFPPMILNKTIRNMNRIYKYFNLYIYILEVGHYCTDMLPVLRVSFLSTLQLISLLNSYIYIYIYLVFNNNDFCWAKFRERWRLYWMAIHLPVIFCFLSINIDFYKNK